MQFLLLPACFRLYKALRAEKSEMLSISIDEESRANLCYKVVRSIDLRMSPFRCTVRPMQPDIASNLVVSFAAQIRIAS